MSPEDRELERMLAEQAAAERAEKEAQGQEVAAEGLTPEQNEQANYWLKQTEAAKRAKTPEQAEKEKVALELNVLFDAWLAPEVLDELYAIKIEMVALTNPLRKAARAALGEILKRIKILYETPEHPIMGPADMGPEFRDKYIMLSRAVGMINSDLVDHTR